MHSKGQLDFLLILTFYKNKFIVKAMIFDRKQSNWDAQAFQFVCFIFVLFFNWSKCFSPNHSHILSSS